MTQLRTIGQYKDFNSIPVGTVFANKACWTILYKSSKNTIIFLASDMTCFEEFDNAIGKKLKLDLEGEQFVANPKDNCDGWVSYHLKSDFTSTSSFYKLPQTIQRLWRIE